MSYETFQLEKYGNVLNSDGAIPDSEEIENGFREQEDLQEWFQQQAELELIENGK